MSKLAPPPKTLTTNKLHRILRFISRNIGCKNRKKLQPIEKKKNLKRIIGYSPLGVALSSVTVPSDVGPPVAPSAGPLPLCESFMYKPVG